jgi:hypothetical protein
MKKRIVIDDVPQYQYGGYHNASKWHHEYGGPAGDDEMVHDYDDPTPEYGNGGKWIQKAVNPAHKGYCTPMTKSTCTPHRKALAMTFKKHHGFHEMGGPVEQYANGGPISPGARIVGYADYDVPYISYPGDTLTDNQIHAARNNRMGPNNRPSVYTKGAKGIYKPSQKDIDKMNKAGYNMHDINRIGMYGFEEIPAPNTYIDTNAFNPRQYAAGGPIYSYEHTDSHGNTFNLHRGDSLSQGQLNAAVATSRATPYSPGSTGAVVSYRPQAPTGYMNYGGMPMRYANGGFGPGNPDDEVNASNVPAATQPMQPSQQYNNPVGTGVVQPAYAPQDNGWNQGMTKDQMQQNVDYGEGSVDAYDPTTGNTDNGQGSNNYKKQQKAAAYGNAFNNVLGAGLMAASNYAGRKNARDTAGYNRQMGMSQNAFPTHSGSKGDYNTKGEFRPNAPAPYNQGIQYGQQKYGGPQYEHGGYTQGSEHSLDENTIQDLIRRGYKVQYI